MYVNRKLLNSHFLIFAISYFLLGMFIDQATISLKAGNGGNGCVAFRREKYVPRGGPSGGDGGHGGDIYMESTEQLNTLLHLRYKSLYKASRGGHGLGSNCHGRNGKDLIIKVPVGTLVYEAENKHLVHDFTSPGERVLIAGGGRGGYGNAHFATATNQAPRHAEAGQRGEEKSVFLELKLIADIGLVGFPNVGKSTLISRISSAKPKIAAYPFTTLTPNLGVVEFNKEKTFVVADIPGLIEGSHKGQGLGDQFLRHIERTKIIAHLVDVSEQSERDPVKDFSVINKELESYSHILAKKKQVLVATKIDALSEPRRLEALEQFSKRQKIKFVPISAVTGDGINQLVRTLSQELEKYQRDHGPTAKGPA